MHGHQGKQSSQIKICFDYCFQLNALIDLLQLSGVKCKEGCKKYSQIILVFCLSENHERSNCAHMHPNPSDLGSKEAPGVASSTVGDHVRSPRDVRFFASLIHFQPHYFHHSNASW